MVEYKAENFGVIGSNPIRSKAYMFRNYNEKTLLYLLPTNDSLVKIPSDTLNSYLYFVKEKFTYYLAFHLRFSQVFYSAQFLDNLAYSIPQAHQFFGLRASGDFTKNIKDYSVYLLHFYLLNSSTHIYLLNVNKSNNSGILPESVGSATTIEDLFYNANWAEREVSEMSGLFFSSKNDTRNLLMPYGEFFHPLKKISPSIGLFELYYDLVSDLIVKSLVNTAI